MSYFVGLRCRECGRRTGAQPLYICDECFGPLEADYDYQALEPVMSRALFAARPASIWRYKELLPFEQEPWFSRFGCPVGFTPLVRARNLEREWKVRALYIKNDSVCFPTLSFKDRVVAVALSKAIEFGFSTVGCSSTGNLANAVAAQAAMAGLDSYIFIPADLEQGKVLGTLVYGANLVRIDGNYDDVNRLSSQVADKLGWGFVNINLRPYYSEGSKTFGYEICEQLGWRAPDNIVVPMAGGSLITKIGKAFAEFERLGLISGARCRIFGAQAAGCAPIVNAVKEKSDRIRPVKPQTIAKSIAIGNPADGYYAARAIRESGGWAADVSDEEIIEGMGLLARAEGIFTETAGGATVAATRRLIDQGWIDRDSVTVIAITGNGLKTQEALLGAESSYCSSLPEPIGAAFSEFEAYLERIARPGEPAATGR